MKNNSTVTVFLTMAILVSACQSDEAETPPDARAAVDVVDERMSWVTSLFTGVEQYEYFNRLAEIFPHNTVTASPTPYVFPTGAPLELPETYEFAGQSNDTMALLQETDTSALLIIQNGKFRYQDYWLTGGPDVNWMSMSVGKSFVSALIGIAIEEGHIESIEEPITKYVPELLGSAYDNVRIKDVLQMSSGARWYENYNDPESDIMRFIIAFGSGGSMDKFTASLVREYEPGTHGYYNSTDTQALGMLLVRATGKSLSAYAEEKLWHPLGMERDAYWVTDNAGMEMAAGGLQVVARDYAKLGQLFLNMGKWNGEQIVSAEWIHDSVTPDAPHIMPGFDSAIPMFGYGYQWWIPDGDDGEFCAIGVYNQFIYVNPVKGLVIVKLSANSNYGTTADDTSSREAETLNFFRSISKQID